MSLGKRLFIGSAAAEEAFCMNTSDNPLQEATSSLVAGYSLDYDASDVTGDYDGTATDVTFGVDGYINWGAEFNGSSSYVSVDKSIFGTGDGTADVWSLSVWFKTDGTISATSSLLGTKGNYQTSGFWVYMISGGQIRYYEGNGIDNSQQLTTTNDFDDSNWHHLVVTRNASNQVTIYVDDTEVVSATSMTFAHSSHSYNLHIGRNAGSSVLFWDGQLDQIRIFNKALSSSEVTTLYNESACTHTATTDTVLFPSTASSNLVAYYKLDGSAEDESSNDYDGTPSNVTYEFGRYGTAARFNGTNGSLDIESSDLIQNNTESFSFWFKDEFVFGFYDPSVASSSDRRRWFIDNGTAGSIKIQVNNDQYNYEETGITTLDGNWHHLVATSGGKLYIDGTPLTDFSTSYWVTDGTNGTSRDTIRIGTSDFIGSASQSYSEGSMDQIRIYDKALTSDEVEELYNEKQAYITKDAENPFEDDDEIAFYKFENNADDEHESYDGADSNVTFTSGSGLFGTYAAEFNGTSSKITTSANLIPTNGSFSVSVWINIDSSGGGAILSRGVVYTGKNYGTGGFFTEDGSGTGTFTFYRSVGTSVAGYYQGTISSFSTNTWHNITYTYDNSSNIGKFYFNGSYISQGTLPSGTIAYNSAYDSGTHEIGNAGRGSLSPSWFDGKIDQLRIFDRVLDGDEVFKLYAEVIN